MRAAVLTEHGQVPELREFPEPPAGGAGEARVEMILAGLNPVDRYFAAGEMPVRPPLPSVVGREGVGLLDGERFYFDAPVAPFGAMAERCLVARGSLIAVPDGVESAVAVGCGIAGLAAWLGLQWTGRLSAGETVLVLGAGGVVGQLAVQVARLLGAKRVVAAARHDASLDRARQLGADATVRTGVAANLAERIGEAAAGADLVFDTVWGEVAVAALGALREGGRLVQVGSSSAAEAPVRAVAIRRPARAILGHANSTPPADVRRAAYEALCGHAACGELTVPTEIVGLSRIATAWPAPAANGPRRKLVVDVAG